MTGAPKGSSGSPTEPAGHTLVSGTPVSQSRWAGQAHTPQQRSPFEDNQRPFRRVPRCNDVARSCPLQTSASTAQARRRAVMRVVGAGEHEPILAPGPVGIRVPRRCGGLCGSDTNGSMRPSDARARIASGRDSGPADHAIFMTTARTGNQWRANATAVLQHVTAAERRFSTPMRVNKLTLLAAANEGGAATRDTTAWVIANPRPESKFAAHVAWLPNIRAEVALMSAPSCRHRGSHGPSRRSGSHRLSPGNAGQLVAMAVVA